MPNERELILPERWSAAAALIALPVCRILLPDVLTGIGLDLFAVNYLYLAMNFLLVCPLFYSFLLRSLPAFREGRQRVKSALVAGIVGHYVGAFILSLALIFTGVRPQTVNNEIVRMLTWNAPVLMLFLTVVAAPVTEECFFRGALFGLLYKRSRVAAYLVTAVAFAAFHAIPGVASGNWMELYSALPYVAPGVALCYVYEKTGTVWTSILLHAIINAVAFILTIVN